MDGARFENLIPDLLERVNKTETLFQTIDPAFIPRWFRRVRKDKAKSCAAAAILLARTRTMAPIGRAI
jgi:hypothetical protein